MGVSEHTYAAAVERLLAGEPVPSKLVGGGEVSQCDHDEHHEVDERGDRSTRCRRCGSYAVHHRDGPDGWPRLPPVYVRVEP